MADNKNVKECRSVSAEVLWPEEGPKACKDGRFVFFIINKGENQNVNVCSSGMFTGLINDSFVLELFNHAKSQLSATNVDWLFMITTQSQDREIKFKTYTGTINHKEIINASSVHNTLVIYCII